MTSGVHADWQQQHARHHLISQQVATTRLTAPKIRETAEGCGRPLAERCSSGAADGSGSTAQFALFKR